MNRTPLREPAILTMGVVAVIISLGTAYAAPKKSKIDEQAVSSAVQLQNAFTTVAESVSPSVVSIRVEVKQGPGTGMGFPFFSMPQGDGVATGGGSGVVIGRDGHVLTNNHVVNEASRIDVKLQDGRSYEAELVGSDPATDLAVLKIKANGLRSADFASSEEARVGQWVIAIGSPFGLDYTVTTGVLSAKGRGGIGANEIEDYLQTDASINPGNSGGPLVDLEGRVLGINTMIIGRGSGIGFAIPSDIAQRVAAQLIKHGEVKRAWLGVSFQELTPELAAHFGGSVDGGALVGSVVTDGPADQAGLMAGDVVVAVDGQTIRQGHDLLRNVLRHGVGERVRVEVLRDGKSKTHYVVMGERPSDAESAASQGVNPRGSGLHGMSLQSLTPELRARLRYEGEGQVVIRSVQPGSAAARAGLRPGDVILKVDHRPVMSAQDVQEALKDGQVLLFIERSGHTSFTLLQADG
jgi:serine protease Do